MHLVEQTTAHAGKWLGHVAPAVQIADTPSVAEQEGAKACKLNHKCRAAAVEAAAVQRHDLAAITSQTIGRGYTAIEVSVLWTPLVAWGMTTGPRFNVSDNRETGRVLGG